MVRTMRGSCPIRPAIEATLITRPQRAGIIDFLPTCCVSTKTPVRLTLTSLSQASSGCSSAGAPQVAPALLTRMSMLPNFSSTAMLVKLLNETDDELRVHHIRMHNREQRAAAEQAAVERIVAWCRDRYRPFRYSESGLDFAALQAIPIDYVSIAFVACQVAIDT